MSTNPTNEHRERTSFAQINAVAENAFERLKDERERDKQLALATFADIRTEARADAIRECVDTVKSMVANASAILHKLEDDGEPDEAQIQRGIQLTLATAASALESLLMTTQLTT